MVGRGGMDNRGVVGRGSMDNRSMVGGGSMVDWGMSNNTSSTMKTVGRVSYSSNTSSKGLGLSGTSVFSLVWLGDRLVGNLASWTSMITSSNYWSISRMTKSMGMCMGHSGVVGYCRGNSDQANKGLYNIKFPLICLYSETILPSCYL